MLLHCHLEAVGKAVLETGEGTDFESEGEFDAEVVDGVGSDASEEGGETDSETGEETGVEARGRFGGKLLERAQR